jgi:hypothetical protein
MTSYSGWNRVVPRFQTQPDFCKGHHQDLFGRTTQSVRFGCINRRNYKPKGLKYHQQLQWWGFNLFGITNDYRENLKSSITKPVAFSRVWTLAGESHSYETSLGFCTYSQPFNPQKWGFQFHLISNTISLFHLIFVDWKPIIANSANSNTRTNFAAWPVGPSGGIPGDGKRGLQTADARGKAPGCRISWLRRLVIQESKEWTIGLK